MTSFTNLKKAQKRDAGFTLLELLIVIAIIAILSIALVFMLNPAETLKKARDAQRISDLKTVKTALGIMLTASSTPMLDTAANPVCTTNTAGAAGGLKIAYSATTTPIMTFASNVAGVDGNGVTFASAYIVSGSSAGKVDGTGWIPVNLKALTGGTPISSFPTDPVNTLAATAATSTDLVYRYACQNGTPTATTKPPYIFEINARLESNAYTVEDNKMAKDGGDNDSFYEAGNSLNLLPTSTGF